MKRAGLIVATLALLVASAQQASAATINFDVDANGNPITAPPIFADTTPLTNLYASLGVTFSGPSPGNGGAILNQNGGFGENALSQPNFLAFNAGATMANGGQAIGPETISFATPQPSVSIYAAGGNTADTFTLDAYNSQGILIGTDVESAGFGQYAYLSVSAPGISYVTLNDVAGVFVADNLTFGSASATPEPSTLALLGMAGASFAGYGWRRRKQAVNA